MPDESILEKVKQSGVNWAMKSFKPDQGTTMVRTKKDAKRVVSILKKY